MTQQRPASRTASRQEHADAAYERWLASFDVLRNAERAFVQVNHSSMPRAQRELMFEQVQALRTATTAMFNRSQVAEIWTDPRY